MTLTLQPSLKMDCRKVLILFEKCVFISETLMLQALPHAGKRHLSHTAISWGIMLDRRDVSMVRPAQGCSTISRWILGQEGKKKCLVSLSPLAGYQIRAPKSWRLGMGGYNCSWSRRGHSLAARRCTRPFRFEVFLAWWPWGREFFLSPPFVNLTYA